MVRPDDELGPEDGERPALGGGPFPDKVLLQPVEVRVVVAGCPLPGRHRDGVQVRTVRLGTLQQAEVLQPAACARQRIEHVGQHPAVQFHLGGVAPAGQQARGLGHRGVHDMGDARRQRRQRGAAGVAVGEVEREVLQRRWRGVEVGRPPGDGDHVPALVEEAFHGGGADQAAGAQDGDGG